MDKIKIVTNNVPRDIVYGYELSAKEKKEFDYYTEEELLDAVFFRYKNNVYDIHEFSRIENHLDKDFSAWDGYISDSFFSGILIKYPVEDWGDLDTDHIIVGWYYC